jgi:hypothetical protein
VGSGIEGAAPVNLAGAFAATFFGGIFVGVMVALLGIVPQAPC